MEFSMPPKLTMREYIHNYQ